MVTNKRRTLLKWSGTALLVLIAAIVFLPLIWPVAPVGGTGPARALASAQSRFVTLPFAGTDGVDLHYFVDEDFVDEDFVDEANAADEPAFVLLHGFLLNAHSWNEVFDFFAARGRVLAYDQLGYGLSEKLGHGDWTGTNPYTIDSAVAMLFALMDAEGIESAVLVGNSAGGPLAMAAALAAPDRVDGLILVDPQVYGTQALPGWLVDLPQVRRLGVLAGRALGRNEWLLRSSYFDDSLITSERVELSAIHTRVDNWDAAIWAVFSTRAAYPAQAEAQIPLLNLPVLVINGAEDSLVPLEASRRLADELPDAELAVLPSCGHLPQEECPDAFTTAVASWLDRR